jgi:hypothetical protein
MKENRHNFLLPEIDFLTYLKCLATLVVTAFLSGACYFAVMSFFNKNSDDVSFLRRSRFIPHKNPSEFEISGTNVRINNRKLEITGVISNVGQQDWFQPFIEITVFVGSLEIERCEKRQDSFIKSGESRNFVVECMNIMGSDVPDFIRLESKVGIAFTEWKW